VKFRLKATATAVWLAGTVATSAPAVPQQDAPIIASTTDEYVVGVEDKLSISVWKETDLAKVSRD
jgi:hypothetical protein